MAGKFAAAYSAASDAIGLANSLGIPTDMVFGGLFEDETATQLAAIEAKLDLLQSSVTTGFQNVTNAVFTTALTAAHTPTILALGTLQNPTAPPADRDDALDSAKEGLVGTTAAINNVLASPIDTVSRGVLELAFESLSLSLSTMVNTAKVFNSGGVSEVGGYNHGGVWRFEAEIQNGVEALRLIETKIRDKYTIAATVADTVFVDEGANTFSSTPPFFFSPGIYHTRLRLNVVTNFEVTQNPDTGVFELDNPGDDFRLRTYVEEFFGPGVQITPFEDGNSFSLILPEAFNRFEQPAPTVENPVPQTLPLASRDVGAASVLSEIQAKVNEINARAEDFLYNAVTDFKVSAALPPDLSFYETDADGIGALARDFEATIAGVNAANTGLIEGKILNGSAFDDFLTGTSVGDELRGFAGNDYLLGNGGNDLMKGGDGSDHYFGGAGDDTIEDDGTTGVDVAIFAGNRSDGSFKIVAGNVVVVRPNGGNFDANTLSGIEVLQFDDGAAELETVLGLVDLIIEGTETADILTGRANNDIIFGFGGDDDLTSAGGADRMEGGTGSDSYHVNDAEDVVFEAADAGIDTVFSSVISFTLGDNIENLIIENATVDRFGTFLRQTGIGNDLDNVMEGSDNRSGGATLHGLGGNDILRAGASGGFLEGGLGDDLLDGGGGAAASYFDATSGIDIDLRDTVQRHTGGLGTDTFVDIRSVFGSNHNDRIIGDASDNQLISGEGNDILRDLGDVGDYYEAGGGNDRIIAGNGDDFALGGQGDDYYKGRAGNDIFEDDDFGDGGSDRMFGGKGRDQLSGGVGDDFLRGNNGNDTLNGGAGEDDLRGGNNNDTLRGGADNDWLLGGGGLDTLNGGAGDDILRGAQGDGRFDGQQDTFVYRSSALGEGGFDRIRDYENGIDLIDLSSFGFTDFDTQVATLASDKSKGLRIDFADGDVLFIHDFLKSDFDVTDVIL